MHTRTIVKSLRAGVIALATLSAIPAAVDAFAQDELQKVKIAVSGTNFLDISYFSLLLPGPLGYWEEEGYEADVFPISGSSEAAQQLAVNNIDFGQMSASVIIQANSQHNIPLRSLITNFSLGWGIAVKSDGPIKTAQDLKGKKIGVVTVSGNSVLLAKAFARDNGLDPDDLTLVATGVGAQPLIALQNDQVQGLMYWSSALVGFQNKDPDLTILKDPKWATLPDYSFATSQRKIDEDPEMVTGVSRGIAKAMVFAAANPDCARQAVWKFYPDSKPSGVDEATAAANDLAMISVLLRDQENAVALNPEGFVAGVSVDAMGDYQDFLLEAGILSNEIDPETVVIPEGIEFWKNINDFDKAAIEADAIACNL